ncbi:hypothetical protein, partial [Pseudomonas syringae group genomosp. 3]|uniref:hypothetical protein n=1 Tax=Pseudomonas syringae group genomosp. 3 TaxID=251701 RepID=UPI0011C38A03
MRNNPGKEPSDRAAYIGLTAAVKSDHKPGCKYDALGQLKLIVADQSDRDFLGALEAGKSELRLLLLHNRLGGKTLSGVETPTQPPTGSAQTRQPTTYKLTDKKLDSYLRTTADILKLRERCEADEVLSANLVLRLGAKKIRWSEFFFEPHRYEDAWQMVRRKGDQCHPFAILGTVERLNIPKPGTMQVNSFLNLVPERNRTDEHNVKHTFNVSIGHCESQWLEKLQAGTEIIAFGVWTATKPTSKDTPQKSDPSKLMTYVNHGLTLFPMFKAQIVELTLPLK